MGHNQRYGRGNQRGGGFGNERGDDRYGGGGGGRGGNRDRPPLEWETEKVVEDGNCQIEITSAKMENGNKRHSLRFGKVNPKSGKTSGFFDPRDISALRSCLNEVEAWLDSNRV